MVISKKERERFERQAHDLAKLETDDQGTPEQRRKMIKLINGLRATAGIEPLLDEEGDDDKKEEFPELGFFRRAVALGMARIRHTDT